MQTFLPYHNFQQSAQCLDRQRLGKQRIETKQIVQSILGINRGWRNHPATIMWEQNVGSLIQYGTAICEEWIRRGYNDSLLEFFQSIPTLNQEPPVWLGDSRVHQSHQSNLLRKSFNHYSQFGWDVPTNLPYFWPGNSNHYLIRSG